MKKNLVTLLVVLISWVSVFSPVLHAQYKGGESTMGAQANCANESTSNVQCCITHDFNESSVISSVKIEDLSLKKTSADNDNESVYFATFSVGRTTHNAYFHLKNKTKLLTGTTIKRE